MIIPVPMAGQHGLVPDLPHHELPLNAWTAAKNVRFRDGSAEKFLGHLEVFNNMLWPPRWLLSAAYGSTSFWLYAGVNKVGAIDGANHGDITRATGGDYSMAEQVGWTGAIIEDIPVINNGFDIPQQWKYPSLATKLADLDFWPADLRVNALRGLKRYLIGLDVTKSGTRFPHMIKWSSQAPTGNVPQSWDTDDETNDAGEWVLPGEGGYLVDGVPLRDALVLYKEYQTWLMQYVGTAQGVFNFRRLFDGIGMLGRRCATEFFSGKHVVFTGDDIVQHDGLNARSLLTERIRTLLQDSVNQQKFHNSFIAINYAATEVWCCVPEVGQDFPTLALVWNWQQDRWGLRSLPLASYIGTGLVSPVQIGETWEGDTGRWNEDTTTWGDRVSDPTKRKMLMALPNEVKLMLMEITYQEAGNNMHAYVERQGLGFPTKHPAPPNYTRFKQVLSVWPHMTGSEGAIVNVSLGTQAKIGGSVTWYEPQVFKIGETEFCDFSDSEASRIHAIKFESNTDVGWRLHGYDVDVIDRGMHG